MFPPLQVLPKEVWRLRRQPFKSSRFRCFFACNLYRLLWWAPSSWETEVRRGQVGAVREWSSLPTESTKRITAKSLFKCALARCRDEKWRVGSALQDVFCNFSANFLQDRLVVDCSFRVQENSCQNLCKWPRTEVLWSGLAAEVATPSIEFWIHYRIGSSKFRLQWQFERRNSHDGEDS